MGRLRVLVVAEYYLPGYRAGGPIRALANLVERLGDQVDFRVLCRDTDFGQTEPYPAVARGDWTRVGRAEVRYLSPPELRWQILRDLLDRADHDVLYLNSFFSPSFTVRPLVLRRLGLIRRSPVVVAPRGEFAPGALALKPVRKRLFLAAARAAGLYEDVVWQASAEQEVAQIRRWFGTAPPVLVAPDVPPDVPLRPDAVAAGAGDKQPGRLSIAFLSRLAPMKNLTGAISMLAHLRGDVLFDVFGPTEDAAYWQQCRELMARLPSNVRTRYHGPVAPEQVHRVLGERDLFLLPSLGESYGHVILEAMYSGCPVVISDRTPWRNLAAAGVGVDLPLEQPDAFVAALQRFVDMDGSELRAWSARARAYAEEQMSGGAPLAQHRALFEAAAARAAAGGAAGGGAEREQRGRTR